MNVIGNVLRPYGNRPFTIAHICNDQGLFGRGIAGQIAQQWPQVKRQYLLSPMKLGTISTVDVAIGSRPGKVVNMIAQTIGGQHPLSLEALKKCIELVGTEFTGPVHIPRIGTGLARSTWNVVYPLIPDNWIVYTLPHEASHYPYDRFVSPSDVGLLEAH